MGLEKLHEIGEVKIQNQENSHRLVKLIVRKCEKKLDKNIKVFGC
jgi:hypothetical protein